MIFFDLDGIRKTGPFQEVHSGREIFDELTVNGQQTNGGEDDDTPTDYTAGDDDNGGETTPQPPEQQQSAPAPQPAEGAEGNQAEDYTVPQEGEGEGSDNPTDAPEDYTVPDESDGTSPDAMEGGGEGTEGNGGPEDYTAEGGDDPDAPAEGEDAMGQGEGAPQGGEGAPPAEGGGGGQEGGEGGAPMEGEGEGEGGGEEEGDDYGDADSGGGSSGDTWDAKIKELEKSIYDNLDDNQTAIRDKELKAQFAELYEAIDEIIERINDISKDADMLKPMEIVVDSLSNLSDTVSDYLVNSFSTKSYTENMINYQRFLHVLAEINKILDNIKPSGSKR